MTIIVITSLSTFRMKSTSIFLLVCIICSHTPPYLCSLSSPLQASPSASSPKRFQITNIMSPPAYPKWSDLRPVNTSVLRESSLILELKRARCADFTKEIEELELSCSKGQKIDLRRIRSLMLACSNNARGIPLAAHSSQGPVGHQASPLSARLESCASLALGSEDLNLAVRAWYIMRNTSSHVTSECLEHMLETVAFMSGPQCALAQGISALAEMAELGHRPEAMLLEAMLEGSVEMATAEGVLKTGISILDLAFEAGVVDLRLHNILIKSLSSSSVRSLEYGLQVFASMKFCSDNSLQPSDSLLSACALVAGGGGCLVQGLHVLNLATKRGLSCKELAFSNVVRSATVAAQRAVEIGLKVLKLSLECNMDTWKHPTSSSCSLLIEASSNLAVGKGSLQLALGLVQRLADSGLKPSADLLSRLIEACAFCGDASGAFGVSLAILDQLSANRMSISSTAAKALLAAFGRASDEIGALHHGLRLLKLAFSLKIPVDRRACNTLIMACARSGGLHSTGLGGICWDALLYLEKSGISLDVDDYERVLQTTIGGAALRRESLLALGFQILKLTIDLGHIPSGRASNSLLLACSKAADVESEALSRSLQLLHRLYENGLGSATGRLFDRLLAACRESAVGNGGLRVGIEMLALLSSRAFSLIESGACMEGSQELFRIASQADGRARQGIVQGIRTLELQRHCGLVDEHATLNFLACASTRAKDRNVSSEAEQQMIEILRSSWSENAPTADCAEFFQSVTRPLQGAQLSKSGDDILGITRPGVSPSLFEKRPSTPVVPTVDVRGADQDIGGGSWAVEEDSTTEPHTPSESIIRAPNTADSKVPATPTPALSANKMLSRIPYTPTRRHLHFGASDSSDASD